MAQKTVMVTISHAPHGSIFYAEGLRATVGVMAGVDEHRTVVVFLGDGAYATLKELDRSEAGRYIASLLGWGSELRVERESLEQRGIETGEVCADVGIIPRAQVLALLDAADLTIGF